MFKTRVTQVITHPLISGSSILIIGGLLANIFNFLFSLFMFRNLSVSEYGIVASLLSIIALSTLPAGAIISTIVRFSATYFANSELGKVKYMFVKINQSLFLLGILSLGLFSIFSTQIGNFFNIHNNILIVLAGINVFASFVAIPNQAIIQGKLFFKFLVSLQILGSFLKLLFGAIFIYFGFSTGGVMWAFFLSTLIPYMYSFVALKFLFDKKVKISKINITQFASFGIPATVALFAISSFVSSDMLLVKHFFPPEQAGLYAGLSLTGKIIFFLSAPVATVMFPMLVQKHARAEKVFNLFLLSLAIIMIPSVTLIIIYYSVPNLIINIFNRSYLPIAQYIGFYGIFVTTYSALILIIDFYLSIKKTWVCIPAAIGAFLQIILIWFYHNDFFQIIFISFAICFSLFTILFIYYFVFYERMKSREIKSV